MEKELTRKQKGFVADIVAGETGVQAALNNFDTTDYMTAAQIANQYLKKPQIQIAIKDALPDELLTKVNMEGLHANRGDEPDMPVRAKYLDMAYKLKGVYAAEKHINLNIEAEPNAKVTDLTDKLNG